MHGNCKLCKQEEEDLQLIGDDIDFDDEEEEDNTRQAKLTKAMEIKPEIVKVAIDPVSNPGMQGMAFNEFYNEENNKITKSLKVKKESDKDEGPLPSKNFRKWGTKPQLA